MVDMNAHREFGAKLLQIYTGAMLTNLINIGYRTGLFEAAAAGPSTIEELSGRAGLHQRYVREWLGAMTTGGIFDYDEASQQFALCPDRAALLTGDQAANVAPVSGMIVHTSKHVPALAHCFKHGGGVGYDAFRPEFTKCMDDVWRRIFDEHLVEGFLGRVDGLDARLRTGIRVLDIGCGTGHAVNVMARAYAASSFVGFDVAEDAIEAARQEAGEMDLRNVEFAVQDVTRLPPGSSFDLITAFDAVHDQREPAMVLKGTCDALRPNGLFMMIEFKFESDIADNISNPFAALYYAFSTMHCTTVSLAAGGPGLGAVWGDRTAKAMLRDAGFSRIERLDSPRPQNCIYVCRK
jgi:ubiquinone/menaquinone biosynthesis C-methylase UbiE